MGDLLDLDPGGKILRKMRPKSGQGEVKSPQGGGGDDDHSSYSPPSKLRYRSA